MKKIKVATKPVEPIIFELEDNELKCIFNNLAFAIMDEEFEEGSVKIMSNALFKPRLVAPKIIYVGLKAGNNDMEITLDVATNIAYSLEIDELSELLLGALENFLGKKQIGKSMKDMTGKDIAILKQVLGI